MNSNSLYESFDDDAMNVWYTTLQTRHRAQGTTALAKYQGAPSHGSKLAFKKNSRGIKCNQIFPAKNFDFLVDILSEIITCFAPVSL